MLGNKDPDDLFRLEMLRTGAQHKPLTLPLNPARLSHAGYAGLSVLLGPRNKLLLVQLVFDHGAFHQGSKIISLRRLTHTKSI